MSKGVVKEYLWNTSVKFPLRRLYRLKDKIVKCLPEMLNVNSKGNDMDILVTQTTENVMETEEIPYKVPNQPMSNINVNEENMPDEMNPMTMMIVDFHCTIMLKFPRMNPCFW